MAALEANRTLRVSAFGRDAERNVPLPQWQRDFCTVRIFTGRRSGQTTIACDVLRDNPDHDAILVLHSIGYAKQVASQRPEIPRTLFYYAYGDEIRPLLNGFDPKASLLPAAHAGSVWVDETSMTSKQALNWLYQEMEGNPQCTFILLGGVW